jgi:hypothetical protein
MFSGTLRNAGQKTLSMLFGNVAWVQWRKLLARNREACCLMEGFLLSITPNTSSLIFWRVVCKTIRRHGKYYVRPRKYRQSLDQVKRQKISQNIPDLTKSA